MGQQLWLLQVIMFLNKSWKLPKKLDKKIPDDFSLIVFDDKIENELYNFPLTKIIQSVLLICKNAATIMLVD